MDQISRPFQIVLAAVAVLAGVWLFAIQGRSSSTSATTETTAQAPATAPANSPTASASSPQAEEKAAAAAGQKYTGSAPGVAGLAGAVAKAHEAVATSQKSAAQVEHTAEVANTPNSAASTSSPSAASSPAPAAAKPGAATVKSTTVTTKAHAPTKTGHTVVVKSKTITTVAAPKAKPVAGAPAPQRSVEAQLAAGNIVVIMFWDPAGSDDRIVRTELQILEGAHRLIAKVENEPAVKAELKRFALELNRKIAVHVSLASQVSQYGTITRGIQVAGTPTIMILNRKGKTAVLTGLQDVFSIEQTIDEVRNA
jgi:hypothetical protein